MILAVALAALVVALLLSALTACAVAVRTMTAAVPAVVGDPPAGIGARGVAIVAGRDHSLAGWFAPGRAGGGAVLLLHGIRSDRRALAARMRCLAGAGFAVLAVDLRAHGESGGARITFGQLEAYDVAVSIAWLRDAAPGERVGGIGISLGGAALLLASRDIAVDAMVLEAVFPDFRSAVDNRVRALVGRAADVVTPALLGVGTALTGLRAGTLRPIEALRRYAGPVLIVSGSADRLTTPEETRAMAAAAGGPADLWMVEGAGHVDMAVAAGPVYEGRVVDFLGRHLRQKTPCA